MFDILRRIYLFIPSITRSTEYKVGFIIGLSIWIFGVCVDWYTFQFGVKEILQEADPLYVGYIGIIAGFVFSWWLFGTLFGVLTWFGWHREETAK